MRLSHNAEVFGVQRKRSWMSMFCVIRQRDPDQRKKQSYLLEDIEQVSEQQIALSLV